MADLREDELDFLIQLENELGMDEGWSDRVHRLWEIIERHIVENKKYKIVEETEGAENTKFKVIDGGKK